MRALIDANIILDVALKRERFYDLSYQVIQAFRKGSSHSGFIAWHSLATVYYIIASDQSSRQAAEQFIKGLLVWSQVPRTETYDAQRAFEFGLKDFEDALQLASAEACDADCIVTRNISDFAGATTEIKIVSPGEFVKIVSTSP